MMFDLKTIDSSERGAPDEARTRNGRTGKKKIKEPQARLGLLAPLPAGLLQQLLVLVLAHLLAAFLDDRAHFFLRRGLADASRKPNPRRTAPGDRSDVCRNR